MEWSQSFYCGPFRRWFRFTAHTKVDSIFTVIWWFSYRAENSHFKIQKLEHYSLSLTPSPGTSRVPLCEWFFFSRPRWKDFYVNLYWNLHHSSGPISHTWKSRPANVLTFIIKNNFMCFAEEKYRKVNVLKFSPHSFLSRLDHSLVEKYGFYVLWCVSFDTANHCGSFWIALKRKQSFKAVAERKK